MAAGRHFRCTLELDPSHAQIHHDYAHFLPSVGWIEESAEACRRAGELDPANPGWVAGWHHQYDVAATYARAALEMAPEQFWLQMTLGWVCEQQGRHEKAVTAATTSGAAFVQAAFARALAGAGRLDEAYDIARALEERAAHEYVPACELAAMYAGFPEPERALAWLRRAVTERSCNLVYLSCEPRFNPLRSHGEFAQVRPPPVRADLKANAPRT